MALAVISGTIRGAFGGHTLPKPIDRLYLEPLPVTIVGLQVAPGGPASAVNPYRYGGTGVAAIPGGSAFSTVLPFLLAGLGQVAGGGGGGAPAGAVSSTFIPEGGEAVPGPETVWGSFGNNG